MRLIHVSNNAEVKIGDRVFTDKGEAAVVRGWCAPQFALDVGRIILAYRNRPEIETIPPSVVNCAYRPAPARAEMVAWTSGSLKLFVGAYNEAVSGEVETFKFQNHTYLVTYAKYLIEYLKGQFNA